MTTLPSLTAIVNFPSFIFPSLLLLLPPAFIRLSLAPVFRQETETAMCKHISLVLKALDTQPWRIASHHLPTHPCRTMSQNLFPLLAETIPSALLQPCYFFFTAKASKFPAHTPKDISRGVGVRARTG